MTHNVLHAPAGNGSIGVYYGGDYEHFADVYSVQIADGYLQILQWREKPQQRMVFIPERDVQRFDV